MKKLFLLFTIIVLVFAGCSIRPAKPTQEWCKWAFNQIPDHKDISEIDSTAFSAEFYNGDSILEPEDSELKFETTEVADRKTTVKVKVYAPSFAPYSPTDYEFDMSLVYEDGLWRIDDWSTPTSESTMKDQVKSYLLR